MIKERRRHKRYKVELLIKSRILGKDKKTRLTPDIDVLTKDVSLEGARLSWPKKWKCKSTDYLGWVFNFAHPFKKDSPVKINRRLDSEIIISIQIDIKDKEPQEVLAKVKWIEKEDESKDNYDVGLNFIDMDRKTGRNIRELIKKQENYEF